MLLCISCDSLAQRYIILMLVLLILSRQTTLALLSWNILILLIIIYNRPINASILREFFLIYILILLQKFIELNYLIRNLVLLFFKIIELIEIFPKQFIKLPIISIIPIIVN